MSNSVNLNELLSNLTGSRSGAAPIGDVLSNLTVKKGDAVSLGEAVSSEAGDRLSEMLKRYDSRSFELALGLIDGEFQAAVVPRQQVERYCSLQLSGKSRLGSEQPDLLSTNARPETCDGTLGPGQLEDFIEQCMMTTGRLEPWEWNDLACATAWRGDPAKAEKYFNKGLAAAQSAEDAETTQLIEENLNALVGQPVLMTLQVDKAQRPALTELLRDLNSGSASASGVRVLGMREQVSLRRGW